MTARILVVDDDESIRNTLEQHLTLYGFDVIGARDGLEGFDRFTSGRPDLVLSDLAMPRADGFTLIQRIRAQSDTPIVVLSVRGGDVDKVRALEGVPESCRAEGVPDATRDRHDWRPGDENEEGPSVLLQATAGRSSRNVHVRMTPTVRWIARD